MDEHRRGQALPDDLLELICVRAAREDRYAAYALALTTHKVCQWTAKARWQTVVIRSTRQLISLWKALYAVPEDIYDAFICQYDQIRSSGTESTTVDNALLKAKVTSSTLAKAENRIAHSLSYPVDGKPHKYVRHLFIDLSFAESAKQDDRTPEANYLQRCCFEWTARGIVAQTDILADPRNVLSRWTCKDKVALDVVSLGVSETDALNWSALSGLTIRELTLVLRKDYLGDLHVDMVPSVERLHIVGADPDGELTGVEPPWTLLRCLTSPCATTGVPAAPAPSYRRLTHLRYDTRRFSLKPAEITAKRLRPLLQEYTVAPRSYTVDVHDRQTSGRTAAASFQFNGPRHAAPARGAGSYSLTQQRSRLTPVAQLAAAAAAQEGDEEAAAQYLRSIGVGQLQLLHFAWEPSHATLPNAPWYKRDVDRDRGCGGGDDAERTNDDLSKHFDQTGGWPREVRGAWTESAERKSNMSSFAVELRDAISTLYGWHAPDVEAAGKFCARIDRESRKDASTRRSNTAFSADGAGLMVEAAQAGITQQDEDDLRSMAYLIKSNVPAWRSGHVEWAEDDVDFLRFGIRAPRSLVHLGGQAALTVSNRLALFEDRAVGGQGAWP